MPFIDTPLHSSKFGSFVEKVKSDGTGLTMVCPRFWANLYPLGLPPVERIIFFAVTFAFLRLKILNILSGVFEISFTKNFVNISTFFDKALFLKQSITSEEELDTGNTLRSSSIFNFNPFFSNQSYTSPAAKRLNDSKSWIPPLG